MGLVKNFLIGLEDKGDWPYGLQNKKVCTHHFDDRYVNEMIVEYGEEGKCSYCGKQDVVCTMQRFMEQVSWKIHMYFDSLDSADLYLASGFYDDDNEVIPGYKRIGEYVVPEEAEYYSSTRNLLDDIGLDSDNEQLNKDIEDVFTTNEWIEKDILHEDYRRVLLDKWKAFAKAVTHARRYTFLALPDFLPLVLEEKTDKETDILSSLRNLIITQNLINTLPTGSVLYRARRVDDINKVFDFNDITAAPDDVATVNRMSPAGISLFYASYDERTAINECVGDKKKALLVGKFSTKKDLRVLDLTQIPGPSFWINNWQENQFLHNFHSEITKKLDSKDTNQLQYIPTQVFTEYLRFLFVDDAGGKLDGMIYGSSKTKEQNIVLFCNQKESAEFLDLSELKRY